MIKGILFSVTASLLFGVVYFLSTVLQPLEGQQLFGWRTLVTLPFLFILLSVIKQHKAFVEFLIQLKNRPHLLIVLCLTSANMGIQMWLFLWAPVNNKAIEVSIGYLLMPLIMVLIGRFFYKERMSQIKAFAVLFAAIGVLSKLILAGVFSWETALVCLGYPVYFAVRRYFNILHLSSFVCEMILLVPVSLYFALQPDMNWVQIQNPNIYWGLFSLGAIGGLALGLYILSSQSLPMNLLGLLGYLEPFCMLIVSFIIGESLQSDSYILMVCLFISIGLLIADGIAKLPKKK